MIGTFLLAIALSPQAPAPSAPPVTSPADEPRVEEPPPIEPYEGGYVEGMRELRTRARAGELDRALALSDRLLAREWAGGLRTRVERWSGGWSERALAQLESPLTWLGMEVRTAADRAEIHYARGIVLHELARHAEARESFGQARVLAGPGRTRLDAIYDLGTSALVEGETWRAEIPEIAGTPPGGASAPGAASDEDPLQRARESYLEAREHLIERLRADWTDEDARANVELALRRLRELEQIEKQRQEQQDQQDQQDSQDQQQKDQQKQQEGEKDGQPKDEQDPSSPDEPQQDPEQQPEKPPDAKDTPPEPSSEEPAGQPEEKELTKEEVQRLLDRLSEHEEEGEEVRAQLKRMRRVPVKRDW